MPLSPRLLSALLIGLLATLGSAQAAMYKWTDAEGNVHYTQTLPPGTDAKTIKAPPPPPAPVKQDAKAAEKEAGDDTDKPTQTKRDEIIKKNCEAARKNLDIYTKHSRILDEKGEPQVLDEKDRQARIQEAQGHIKEYCK